MLAICILFRLFHSKKLGFSILIYTNGVANDVLAESGDWDTEIRLAMAFVMSRIHSIFSSNWGQENRKLTGEPFSFTATISNIESAPGMVGLYQMRSKNACKQGWNLWYQEDLAAECPSYRTGVWKCSSPSSFLPPPGEGRWTENNTFSWLWALTPPEK